MTQIILDNEINADPSLLDRAWGSVETFALVPEKSGSSLAWVGAALAKIPASHRVGHFVLLTSGSTGTPKLIIGRRERSEQLARVLHEVQKGEPVAETIVALPLTYSYAFVNQWLWSHIHGRKLTVTPGFRQADVLKQALQRAGDAMLCLVGIQVPLLEQNFGGDEFPGVIRVHFAGGRFPEEQLPIVRGIFPNAKIFNNYGCAEALPRLTFRAAEDAAEAANIGRPLAGVCLQTSDSGEIVFRSPYGAVGIVDEQGFHEISPEKWVGTGDMGCAGDDGMWRLTGRASEVFKRYGEKISLPRLLTTVLKNWDAQAAFYREADVRGEEGHVLVLAPHPGEPQVRTILKAFAAEYGRAHWPLRVESIAEMPLLSNGKVDSKGLAQLNDKQQHWHQR
jgi:fatty-acyl-CoA synthase